MSTTVNRRADLPEMPEIQPRRFTRDEFYRMAEAGVFGVDERLELVDGEIISMSPKGPGHVYSTEQMVDALNQAFRGENYLVRTEQPIVFSDRMERYPDVAVVSGRRRDYLRRHPAPADVALLVEVSDTSVTVDRIVKGPEYAAAGIPEYWIVNIPQGQLEVYREPGPTGYRQTIILGADDRVTATAAPDAAILVSDLLPLAEAE